MFYLVQLVRQRVENFQFWVQNNDHLFRNRFSAEAAALMTS